MNRIDRLTAMIIYLQGRSWTTVEELSERYEISNRTVYRDLKALQEAGVPIGSEGGKGYFIVRGYHLPPVMFNKQEAAALLAAERAMQKWNETALSSSYLSALDKIRAVLRQEEKEYLDALDRHIKVHHYPDEKIASIDSRIFSFLHDAIYKKQIVVLEYHSPYRDELTRRKVEPLGLLLMGNHWYLAGWCYLRNDYRRFRLDRIEHFRGTNEKFEQSSHSLKEFYEESLNEEKELQQIVVRFSHESLKYMGDQKYYHGWVSEEEVEDGVEMTFLSPSPEYFARWLLIWGNMVVIREPGSLKERIQKLSEELYRHHIHPKSDPEVS